MKHKGSKCDLNMYRDRDLQRTFKKVYSENPCTIFMELVKIICASPAERFWVSEERAVAVVSQIERGVSLDGMNRERIAMYTEIYRRYVILRQKHPSFSMSRLVSIIVHQPAPRFYLTAGTARVMLYKLFRKCKEQRKLQLR